MVPSCRRLAAERATHGLHNVQPRARACTCSGIRHLHAQVQGSKLPPG